MKHLLTLTATGTALAGLAVLAAVGLLILFVIPGGLGILTIQFERIARWLRQARDFFWRTKPASKPDATHKRGPLHFPRLKLQPDLNKTPTEKPI